MTEQRTTPEMRQALRQKYTPEPEPRCPECGEPMANDDDAGNIIPHRETWWRCPAHPEQRDATFPLRYGDPRILALLDDADALAGALAEVEGLRSGLAFYKPEAERYRAVLKTIQGWDCLNPPQADLCADLPWLRRLVDAALDPETKGPQSDDQR
jgi:hypothetical protein